MFARTLAFEVKLEKREEFVKVVKGPGPAHPQEAGRLPGASAIFPDEGESGEGAHHHPVDHPAGCRAL